MREFRIRKLFHPLVRKSDFQFFLATGEKKFNNSRHMGIPFANLSMRLSAKAIPIVPRYQHFG
jgi:hypothetical protein